MRPRILLIADTLENRLLPSTADLAAAANHLRRHTRGSVMMIVPGQTVQAGARAAAAQYGMDVMVVEHAALFLPNPPLLLEILRHITTQQIPDFILLPHTMRGCGMAAVLAGDMDAACITAVEGIERDAGAIVFQRSVFNGKLMLTVDSRSPGSVLTICPGAFSPTAPDPDHSPGRLSHFDGSAFPAMDTVTPVRLIAADDKDHALEDADVIVAAGRGIRTAENLSLIRETAALFKNGTVAGSRTLCDLGWLPHARQVGETGHQVGPRLYMACGISGARQHTMGIKNAQTVVAVNTDPDAAIFAVADYGIVEDLTTFLPLLATRSGQRVGLAKK